MGVVEEWESGGGQGDVPTTWNGRTGTGEGLGKARLYPNALSGLRSQT